ncbi:hypothetical protein UlMin_037480 [Ulmus minor]
MNKELCRNFQRGSCRYGERCRYLHVTPQQPKSQPFGSGAQSGSYQQQKPNPFGFGVQNNSQSKAPDFGSKPSQLKPFENKWTRSSAPTASAPSSRKSENQTQATNHECTDPESCRRIIVEDFQHERPLWKLTCYGHWKHRPCDIVGDISYEELRAAAYDDAKRGLSLQSIVERERNLLNSKLSEFENLSKARTAPPSSALANQTFPKTTFGNQNSVSKTNPNAFSQPSQSGGPASVSSFSQLGMSLKTSPNAFSQPPQSGGPTSLFFFLCPIAPLYSTFAQPNPFANSSQNLDAFGTKTLQNVNTGLVGGQFPTNTQTSLFKGFGDGNFTRAESNPFTTASVSGQTPMPNLFTGFNTSSNIANRQGNPEVNHGNKLQTEEVSGIDTEVWLREKWNPGEIPEEAPPEAFCS